MNQISQDLPVFVILVPVGTLDLEYSIKRNIVLIAWHTSKGSDLDLSIDSWSLFSIT